MWYQCEIRLKAYPKGFHLITHEILSQLPELPGTGLIHLFICHTSAGLTINENADPTVRMDFKTIFEKLVPESRNYLHNSEGDDDMPAHIKASLAGNSLTIPVRNEKPALGTWQGIYLCEFREHGGNRKLLLTITGE